MLLQVRLKPASELSDSHTSSGELFQTIGPCVTQCVTASNIVARLLQKVRIFAAASY